MGCNCNNSSCSGCGAFETPEGSSGTNGWSPQFDVVRDGLTREVLQLTGWTGGTGTTPGHIGEYLSSSGYTANIALAENIRGSDGTPATFTFIQVNSTPDQSVSAPPVATVITGTSVTPAAGTYNITFYGVRYGTGATDTASYGIYKDAALQATLVSCGPATASEKYSIAIQATNVVFNGAEVLSVKCTTAVGTMVLFSFQMVYQKIA